MQMIFHKSFSGISDKKSSMGKLLACFEKEKNEKKSIST